MYWKIATVLILFNLLTSVLDIKKDRPAYFPNGLQILKSFYKNGSA